MGSGLFSSLCLYHQTSPVDDQHDVRRRLRLYLEQKIASQCVRIVTLLSQHENWQFMQQHFGNLSSGTS